MTFLAAYIMQGRWRAAAVASALAFLSLLLPPASILSSATIALVTLRLGAHDGIFVLLCACAISTLMSMLLLDNYLFALVYGFVLWLPVWIISIILRETRQLSLVLQISVGFSVLVIAIVYFLIPEPSVAWNRALSLVVEPIFSEIDAPEAQVKLAIANMSKYMTGITVTGFVSGLLLDCFWVGGGNPCYITQVVFDKNI